MNEEDLDTIADSMIVEHAKQSGLTLSDLVWVMHPRLAERIGRPSHWHGAEVLVPECAPRFWLGLINRENAQRVIEVERELKGE